MYYSIFVKFQQLIEPSKIQWNIFGNEYKLISITMQYNAPSPPLATFASVEHSAMPSGQSFP